jgi:outer membrane lipoprotein LolB
LKRRLALVGLAALGGCAPLPPTRPAAADTWTGKLGYRLEAAEGERAQAGSASFELQGNASAGQLDLTSPLGTTLASARWGPDGLRLFDGQQHWAYPSLADLGAALGERLGGAPLPLAALFDWLRGQPWAQAAHTPLEAEGFEQLGWRVNLAGARLQLRQQRLTLTLLLTSP